ncbi:hypothetical protein ACFFHM_11285 [Halalkalibacter kiskunsagensis]|uniref:Uncharacterized protein n=1 Tax=Halalkalibacter kiskunsagensis TaxID=1548599 RepID=A0ABV6KDJ8_9BACI
MNTKNSIDTMFQELEEMNAINLLPNPEQFVYKLTRYFENENLSTLGSIYNIEGNTPLETTAKRLYKDLHEVETIYNNATEMIGKLYRN